jgi:hypothetical protein
MELADRPVSESEDVTICLSRSLPLSSSEEIRLLGATRLPIEGLRNAALVTTPCCEGLLLVIETS